MDAVCLRFYSLEKRKLHGMLVHDWLLAKARDLGQSRFSLAPRVELSPE